MDIVCFNRHSFKELHAIYIMYIIQILVEGITINDRLHAIPKREDFCLYFILPAKSLLHD
jgi:hypothetical protein